MRKRLKPVRSLGQGAGTRCGLRLTREQTRRCQSAKATCALGQIPPACRVVFQIREARGWQVIDRHIAVAQCVDKVVQAGVVTDDHDARSGIWQATHDFRQCGSIRAIHCGFDRQRIRETARGGGQFRCLQRPPRIRGHERIRHPHKRVQVGTNGRRVAASSVGEGAEAVTGGRIGLSLGVPQDQQLLDLDHPPFEAMSTKPEYVNETSESPDDTGAVAVRASSRHRLGSSREPLVLVSRGASRPNGVPMPQLLALAVDVRR